jgi:hypothetical protein
MALMELQSWCDSNGKGLKIYVARELVRYTHIFLVPISVTMVVVALL